MDCKKNAQTIVRDMEDKDKNNIWRWIRKSYLKGCIEALIFSPQEQSLRTNYIKHNIDKIAESRFVGCMVQVMRLYLIQ